ncbi:MAG: monodechloroaminopyrrolnitrin synthase PrnB family protein, partial [Pseudomonadota bacterium]
MSQAVDALDRWIRSAFVEMNTELEELYFSQDDRADVEGVGESVKQTLLEEGRALIAPVAKEGNTDQGFDHAYDLLGNLGLYMGALRRHELTNPAREDASPFDECSALGMHIG